MKLRNGFRRYLAFFLSLMMLMSCLPLAAIAEEVVGATVEVVSELPADAIIEVHEKVEEPTPEPTAEPTPEPTPEPTQASEEPAVLPTEENVPTSTEAPVEQNDEEANIPVALSAAMPVAEEPQAEEPQAEEPQAEEPQAEEPQAEEPQAEEPQAEEPQAEEPQAEEPQAEEPQAEEPQAEEPQAEEPQEEEPQAEEPQSEESQVTEPESGKYAVVVTIESGNTYTEYYSAGEVVTLSVPSKEHYTFLGWESVDVDVVNNKFTMPAQLVNVSAKWDPEVHTVTIYYVSTNGEGNMPVADTSDIEYGKAFALADTYELPKVNGFTAFKVVHGSDVEEDIEKYRDFIKVDSVEKDERFYVYYEPAEVQYTVYRYMQNVDGTYSQSADEITTKNGKYGDKVYAKTFVQSYTGFTWDNNNTMITLSSDATSNVLRLYYTRNTYNLIYQTTDDTETQELKFGETVDINSLGTPTRAGYTFAGWKTADGSTISAGYTMPAHDVTLFADWTPANVNYTIRYWQENLASANNMDEIEGYDYIESSTAQALTGSKVSGSNTTSYTGFEFDHADTDVTVKADGSTVVNVYYRRTIYHYYFKKSQNGGVYLTLTYKYGADLSKAPYEWPYETNYYWFDGTSIYGCPTYANVAKDVTLYHKETESSISLYGWYAKTDSTPVVLNTWNGTTSTWLSSQKYTPEGYTACDYENGTPVSGSISKTRVKGFEGFHVILKKNTYVLTLNNGESDFATHSYLYGDDISNALADMNVSEITPPVAYTGYNFAGWTYKYQPYTLDGKTMPAYNMVLVATWEIPVYTVNFYDDNTKTNLLYSEEVERGSTVLNDPEAPTKENYEFAGWYYMDGDVEKLYFDGKPINKDIDVYAKWTLIDSRKVDVTIYHKYYDATGTNLLDEEQETIQVTVGTTATVYSKTVSGYYPELLSQNVEAKENTTNEATFKYLKLDGVQYTVHYVDQDGNKLIADKVEMTSKMDIVEVYEYIAGATPRTISQSLRLTANPEQNVITFVYDVEGTTSYVVKYYLENVDGTYKLETTETIEDARYYTEVSAEEKTFDGFEYNAEISTSSGWVVPKKSLILKMYYTRMEYEVTYVYTGTVPAGVAELPESVVYKVGAEVTVATVPEAPKGYHFEGWTVTNETVTVSDGKFTMPKESVVIEGAFVQEDYWLEVEWDHVDGVYCGGEYKWDCDKLEYVYSSGAAWKTEPSVTFTITNYGSKSVNLELSDISDSDNAWNKYLSTPIANKNFVLGGNGATTTMTFSGSDFVWNYDALNATALDTALNVEAGFVLKENTFKLLVTEAE